MFLFEFGSKRAICPTGWFYKNSSLPKSIFLYEIKIAINTKVLTPNKMKENITVVHLSQRS